MATQANSNPSPWLSITEAAQILGVHKNTINNLIIREQLKAFRIARIVRIHREDLNALLTPYKGGEQGLWNQLAK